MELSSLPSIEVSFRFHPPTVLSTLATPAPVVDYKSAVTYLGFPSQDSDMHFMWITSYTPQTHASHPPTQPPATLFSSAILTATSQPESTQQSNAKTAGGAKIGLAVGITVATLLSLTIMTLAIMESRRRFKRRKARKQTHDSMMKGIWAGVKVEDIGRKSRTAREGSKRDGLWGKEWMGSKVVLLERFGEGKQGGASGKEPDWLPEWIPVYVPKDRRSVVSDDSMASSMMGQPVEPMDFLGKEVR